jgi:hypothetical protein
MSKFFQIISTVFILLFVRENVQTQDLYSIHSRWSDDFSEWLIFTENSEYEWYMGLKWPLKQDLTEWEYEVEGNYGVIKLKWRNDPNLWEIRGDSDLIIARTIWKNDFSEWRITSGDFRITLKSTWKNTISEWSIKEKKYGGFVMKTEYTNDPRDWQIYDDLDPDVPLDIKMAIVFLVVFNSFPK